MTSALKLQCHTRVEAGLDGHSAVTHPLPAWGIKSLLRIKTEINIVHYDLNMSLRLHVSSHDPERTDWLSVLHQEAWYDRVICALSGSQAVDIIRIKREIRTAVLQLDPGAVDDDP